jgi:hypothetical protein
MSYQEKRTISLIATSAAVLAAYCLYAFGKAGPAVTAPEDLRAWASVMLIFVGISIVATIALQIIFHILLSISIAVKEAAKGSKEIERAIGGEMIEDERDKLIDLKSSRISLYTGGFGFILGLLALVLGYSPALMINIVYLTFSAGAIIEGLAKLFLYRRGVKHA